MVQRYVVHNTEMHRISGGDLHASKEWSLVVKYKDYAAIESDFQDYITTTEMELSQLREKLGLSS